MKTPSSTVAGHGEVVRSLAGSGMQVRALENGQIEEISALAADVFRFAYGCAYRDADAFERYLASSFHPDQFAEHLHRDCLACLVGEFQCEAGGVLKMTMTPTPEEVPVERAVQIETLYVLEKFHGRGLARLLMEGALELAEDAGFHAVWLCVWEHNPRALAFYRKHGFAIVGDMVTPMNDVPFRDYVMWKRLG